nr:ATP-dependent Clp protease proteolytic subunit [Desertifilum tharense]
MRLYFKDKSVFAYLLSSLSLCLAKPILIRRGFPPRLLNGLRQARATMYKSSAIVLLQKYLMDTPIRAAQSPYYGDAYYRTPPPDLPSLLLKERIVYLGLPLFSDDDTKRRVGVDVTELIIAQLLYLEFDNPEKPISFYINSTGTSWYGGEAIGFETEAFAICDTLSYIKPPVHTICIGQAMGTAAMILSAGTKGCRASLPHATIVLNQSRTGARGQATDIQIRAKEVLDNKATMLEILSRNTGQPPDKIAKDTDRMLYMSPYDAVEYGLIDRVLESTKDLPKPLPAAFS